MLQIQIKYSIRFFLSNKELHVLASLLNSSEQTCAMHAASYDSPAVSTQQYQGGALEQDLPILLFT